MDSCINAEVENRKSKSYVFSGRVDQRIPEKMDIALGKKLYRMLWSELERAGCFRPAPWFTLANAVLVVNMYAAGFTMLLVTNGIGFRLLALLLLAFANVHAGFLAHETGHGAITPNRRLASALGQFLMTFLTGLCYSHFQNIHRRHHPYCNEEAVDPDMQSGAFSMYENSARQKTGLGKLISRYQAYLIWVLVSLQGLTLKIDGIGYVRRNPKLTRADQIVFALHIGLWFGLPTLILGLGDALLNYGLMTWFMGPYLGAVFLVNHIGTRVIRPKERISFFHKQIATTRNLGTSRVYDFLFGGINNHIEHHLYPSIPTARLRTARSITRAFCKDHGIPYREMGWLAAAREVFYHFKDMSKLAWN